MLTAEEIRKLKGQWVRLQLAPDAPGGPVVTGRVMGIVEAADGFLLTVEPDGRLGRRLTVHHHHILALTTTRPGR